MCLRNRGSEDLILTGWVQACEIIKNEPVTLAPSLTSCRLNWGHHLHGASSGNNNVSGLFWGSKKKRCFECWAQCRTQSCAVCVIKLVMIVTFLSSLYWLFREELVLSGQTLYFPPSQGMFLIAEASSCYRKKAKQRSPLKMNGSYDTKSISTKENNELDFIKIKQFCLQGHHQQSEENPQNRKKYVPIIYLIKELYLDCIKS